MLERYWPTREEVDRCIKSEAESADVAVLLAVHQKTPLVVRNAGSNLEEPTREEALLDAFLTDNLPEGTLLLPVMGTSGSGKSHIIRWLDAQLRRDPRARHMHVIRIPKSASLRTVVELILEPLADSPRYADARREMEKAVAEVTPADGAIRFAAELEIALKRLAERLTVRLRENPQAPDAKGLKSRLDHARKLPAFFGDAVLQEHFKGGVLARIVERAIKGRNIDERGEGEILPQFTADDLVVPNHLDLGKASQTVKLYYQTVLNRDDGGGRQVAADVLNEVVDEAIRNVFRLGQAMGGVTLEEIILHIRDLLMKDGRELILLVEDFAALSGIHEILLRVAIQEAVYEGRQVRARMRTALALTDGYLAGRDTILTRARREWLIRSSFDSPDTMIERTVDLVGAYLNAGRCGENQLRKRFEESTHGAGDSLTGWVRRFEDDDSHCTPQEAEVLDAFGRSAGGYSLFPFNRQAIRSLAEIHLKVSGELQFNPRRVIQFILRDVLLRRDEFQRSQFPPPLRGARVQSGVASWLAQAVVAPDVRARVESFLAHWGGNPAAAEDVAILSPLLFEPFDLPSPNVLGLQVQEPRPGGGDGGYASPRNKQVAPQPQPPAEDVFVDWRKRLEDWSAGTRLRQQDARLLRSEIARAIDRAIDWNAWRLKKRPITHANIILPNAAGGGQAARVQVAVAETHEDPNGLLRRTLLAVERYHHYDHTWNFPEAAEDSALFANLIEDLARRLAAEYQRLAEQEVAPLADALVRQGQVLGIVPKRLKTLDDLVAAVMAPAPDLGPPMPLFDGPTAKWDELRREAATHRKELQNLLTDRIGCFQGTGDKLFGIDVARLLSVAKAASGTPPTDAKDLVEGPLRSHLTQLGPSRLPLLVQRLAGHLLKSATQVREVLGDTCDKAALIASLKEILPALEKSGAWPAGSFDKGRLHKQIEEFHKMPVMEVLRKIEALQPPENGELPLESMLHVVSSLDLVTAEQMVGLTRDLSTFVTAAEKQVAMEEKTGAGADPAAKADTLDQVLSAMIDDLAVLDGEEITA